jgi:hypothetical protein
MPTFASALATPAMCAPTTHSSKSIFPCKGHGPGDSAALGGPATQWLGLPWLDYSRNEPMDSVLVFCLACILPDSKRFFYPENTPLAAKGGPAHLQVPEGVCPLWWRSKHPPQDDALLHLATFRPGVQVILCLDLCVKMPQPAVVDDASFRQPRTLAAPVSALSCPAFEDLKSAFTIFRAQQGHMNYIFN